MNGNEAATALVSQAANRCTVSKPFVTQHLDNGNSYQVLNSALNFASSIVANGHISENISPGSTIGCWFVLVVVADNNIVTLDGRNCSNLDSDAGRLNKSKLCVLLLKEDTIIALTQLSESILCQQDKRFHSTGLLCLEKRWLLVRSIVKLYIEQPVFHNPGQHLGGERTWPINFLRIYLSVPVVLP